MMNFPRLNELATQQQSNYKKHSVLHNINNTFLRNTILQNNSMPKLEYQSRLTSDHFVQKDLLILFKHLFNKPQLTLTDRNLIRRILLTSFNQQFICAGGRQFINYLNFKFYQKSMKFKPLKKELYFILKGAVTISVCGYGYKKKQGQHFGQLQLLSETKIDNIQIKSDAIILSLSQDKFNEYFRPYFLKIYQQKEIFLSSIGQILEEISSIYKYILLSYLQKQEYKTGDKIVKKRQPLEYVYFTSNIQISSTQNRVVNSFKAIGLYQLSKSMTESQQNIYCMQNNVLYKIKIDQFRRFVPQSILTPLCSSLNLSKSKSKQKQKSQDSQQKIQNFVRIRKVKFNQKRRIHTEYADINPQFMTSFIFIKDLNQKYKKKMTSKIEMNFTRRNTSQKNWLSQLTQASPSSLYSCH